MHIEIVSQAALAVTGIRTKLHRFDVKTHFVTELKKKVVHLAADTTLYPLNDVYWPHRLSLHLFKIQEISAHSSLMKTLYQ